MPLTMLSASTPSNSLPELRQDVSHFNPFFSTISTVPPRFLRLIGHLALAVARRGGPAFVPARAHPGDARAVTSSVPEGFQMFEQASQAPIQQGLPCEWWSSRARTARISRGIVVSAAFEGKMKVRQHQAVYATLGRLMGKPDPRPAADAPRPRSGEEGRGELGRQPRMDKLSIEGGARRRRDRHSRQNAALPILCAAR